VHPNPLQPYSASDMQQIVIGRQCKADFRRKLDSSGVHQSAIFADLDGLSRRLIAVQAYRNAPLIGANGAVQTALSPPEIARNKALAKRKTVEQATNSPASRINPRDPQKGQWGGKSIRNNWEVSAAVTELEVDWYDITLTVKAQAGTKKRLSGKVQFHLHDTFPEPVLIRGASGGRAVLNVQAYGAFTVGVLVERDETMLEIDLSKLKTAPKKFREQ
jgi:hypothetical protein